ncbi:MAG: hypothetical protein AAFO07_19510 [Bacteroidota bacterium]
MIKNIYNVLLAAILILSIQSCNPDCDTVQVSNVTIPPGPYEQGTELAIQANPAGAIEGRSIFVTTRTINSTAPLTTEVQSRFVPELGATVVEIPTETNDEMQFLIEDPDCGNLIPIGTQTNVVESSFFVDNPFFVTPTPPLIIIPTPPVAPPPAVVNAWFSPNNRDYCIWFNPTFETLPDGTEVELPTLIPAGSPNGIGPVNGSAELAVGCGETAAVDRLYHNNPVTGIVDKENNIIRISIDRTSKNLGVEEFVGQFINPENLPADTDFNIGGRCSSDGTSKPNIMFLTSLQTGRQMILFRGLD